MTTKLRPLGNLIYLHAPSGAYVPGQLVDGRQGFVQREPSARWTVRRSPVAAVQLVGKVDARGLLASLSGSGEKVEAALAQASDVRVELAGAERREIGLEQLNWLPAGQLVREDYTQLEEAFQKESEVRLIAAVVYATKFRIVTAQAKTLAGRLREAGVVYTQQGDIVLEVTASAADPVAVAYEVASPAFKLRPAGKPTKPARVVELPNERQTFGLVNHGLHNVGPYRTQLNVELIERTVGQRREVVLIYSGEVKNPNAYSPQTGSDEKVIAELGRGAYWTVEPVGRSRAEVVRTSNDYAGAASHADFGNAWIETFELAAGKPAWFALKPTRVLIYE